MSVQEDREEVPQESSPLLKPKVMPKDKKTVVEVKEPFGCL